ncbi:hypothetical protein Q4I28_001818 [Leishmania naiffi]|uniref:Uncharacterized protein n=1 Tax=Leishmania naiffi TaxID=5678 RepID=A0AAW3C302_9TRYP
MVERAAADAKHPAELRPGEGGHIHLDVRAAGVREWKWSTASRAPVWVKGGGGPTPPSPAREPDRPIRLIDVARALSSELREEVGARNQDEPSAPLHLEEMRTPHKELSRAQPRAALVLKLAWHSARRMGQYPGARRTCRRLLWALLTTHHGNGAKLRGLYATGAPLPREDALTNHGYLTAKHSAHAEPRAAMPCLQALLSEGLVGARGRTLRIAPATGESAIVAAQGTPHGFGGVGRGHWLNWPRAHTRSLYFSEGA